MSEKIEILRQIQLNMNAVRRALLTDHARWLVSRGTSLHELQALDLLHPGEWRPQTALVTRLSLDRATVSRVVARLREAGHVEVETDPRDRRGRLLRITASGSALHEQMSARLFEHIEEKFEAVSVDELQAALHAFRRMAQTLGVEPDPATRGWGDPDDRC